MLLTVALSCAPCRGTLHVRLRPLLFHVRSLLSSAPPRASRRLHRFAREDTIDEEWRIVEPILDLPTRPYPYYRHTWGPGLAEDLPGGWHDVQLRQ